MPADNPKTTCAAFGCKRWTRRFPGGPENGFVYLCPDHWAMVPQRLRRLTNRAFRIVERGSRAEKDLRRVSRLWRRCVEQANRNLGI
jgi:hypothetical protein